VPVDHGEAVKVSGLKGQASCSSARSIAKTYGHPAEGSGSARTKP
jgi:hypothetical protein